MVVLVQPNKPPDIDSGQAGLREAFLDALAAGATAAGHTVARRSQDIVGYPDALVVWNGRDAQTSSCPVIFCEHGWLPRWAFQVSWRGFNAESHLAPYVWDGVAPSAAIVRRLNEELAAIRQSDVRALGYMQTDLPAVSELPNEFLLAPLQIEGDMNMKYVPPGLCRMQNFVDVVSRAYPPLPVVFKQHPVDAKKCHHHLQLSIRRPGDVLRPHHLGNVHQILKTGRCRGIITLNSNVAHDGLIWNVPSVALGRNVWPTESPSPFLHALPDDWSALFNHWKSAQNRACRDAYVEYLLENQWTVAAASDPVRVHALLRDANASYALSAASAKRRDPERESGTTKYHLP